MSGQLIFFISVICSLSSLPEIAFGQDKPVKEKKRENVFLHPRKFYKKYFPHLRIKRDPLDTAYIKMYPNYLSVSTFMLSPSNAIDISSRNTATQTPSKLRTSIGNILGVSATYRFIGAGFAFVLNPASRRDDYVKSRYRTATIKYNSKAYSLQFKYLRIKGFTDIAISPTVNTPLGLMKRPDVVNKEFQFEGLYNPRWQKYSYIAPLTFSQRQIKNSTGLLVHAGVYYSQLSSDSSLIVSDRAAYGNDVENMKAFRSLSIRLAPGLGSNFVFLRRYYLSLIALPSYDLYFYKYLNNADEKVKGRQTFMFSIDGKASLGYHSERIFGGLRIEVERRSASLRGIKMKSLQTYIGLEFGYRFKAPKIVKKVYRETMPPGM